MVITTTDTALLRLLHLCTANLPVGAYAWSQGLEAAIDLGWVKDVETLEEWLALQLGTSLGHVDIPLLFRLHEALDREAFDAIEYWNDMALACRESGELHQGDITTGSALLRLLKQMDIPFSFDVYPCSFVTAFAQAAHHWQVKPEMSANGLLWSWLENQVISATKLMPLGQAQAHNLLGRLQEQIPGVVEEARVCPDEMLGASLPALAIATCHHETQYTRLFRS